jgi:hypothetical protein
VQQPRAPQRRPPPGIRLVRVPAGHMVDVRGVDHEHHQGAFQEVRNRVPVRPRPCDGHRGHAHLAQPIRSGSALAWHRSEVLHFQDTVGVLTGGIGGHPAGRAPLLVDIPSCPGGKDDIHAPPHQRQAGGIALWRASPWRALLPCGSWRPGVVPADIQSTLLSRRAALGKKRPRDQPFWSESILLLCGRVATSHFHASWCPKGHGNSSEAGVYYTSDIPVGCAFGAFLWGVASNAIWTSYKPDQLYRSMISSPSPREL